MKKYVLITWGIAGIGGGQFYTLNRCNYYRNNGYSVFVCHLLDGEVLLPELNSFPHLLIPNLRFDPNAYLKHRVNLILKRIENFICFSEDDEILVESNSIAQAQWAEMLAKRIKAKHFYYILGEHDKVKSLVTAKFVEFKINRGEVAGITVSSVPKLMNNWRHIENGKKYAVTAPLIIDIIDYPFPSLENLNPVDFTIGVMARLEKLFVLPTLIAIAEFCTKHIDKSFRIIIAGDTDNTQVKKNIMDVFANVHNVILLMTGYISPVPKRYFDICDLCVSSSGCAGLSDREGTLTISIDAKDCLPIGILGFTTNNRVYRQDEPAVPLASLLEDVLIKKKYPFHHERISRDYTVQDLMKKEIDYINNSCAEKEYYEFSEYYTWQSRKKSIKERLYQFVKDKFGSKAIRVIHKIHHSIN